MMTQMFDCDFTHGFFIHDFSCDVGEVTERLENQNEL